MCEWLVQEYGPGVRKQRARDRNALPLAARKPARTAFAQMVNVQRGGDIINVVCRSARDASRSEDCFRPTYARTTHLPGTRPRCAVAAETVREMLTPPSRTSPERTGINPAIARSSVVLPAPDGPTIANTSPGGTANVRPFNTGSRAAP